MNPSHNKNLDYYLKSNKFIRDHAHKYVYLTDFELSLVDTIEFQRLKDVRQLTCQHVYPGGRHTRFEHSLGVMELTRRAVNALNDHGYISGKSFEGFEDNLQFNVTVAALLHDVGHCPFSHLGEREFDRDEVWRRLCSDVAEKLPYSDLNNQMKPLDISELGEDNPSDEKKLKKLRKKFFGAVHEQLSCCMILENMYDILAEVEEDTGGQLKVDFELLCRCILGKEYNTSLELYSDEYEAYELNVKKNVLVHLISAKAFDMDKLDYIIRDTYMTGIGAPTIDTDRLFRNMFLSDNCTLVFSSRAVPALQNMIDARDQLYMYVYNHHAVIFSDFMYTYIFRRLAHNARDFTDLLEVAFTEIRSKEQDEHIPEISLAVENNITNIGSVPKDYLFSPGAILEENRSDGDLTSLLNVIHLSLKRNGCNGDNQATLRQSFASWVDMNLPESISENMRESIFARLSISADNDASDKLVSIASRCLSKIQHTYVLIDRYMRRSYLKPWWKTYSEFNLFLAHYFPSDDIRRKLCDWICNGPDDEPEGDEFRSQLAKHVSYITKRDDLIGEICEPLSDGDFFVIERSAKFFDPETLKELEIAQKTNEIVGAPGNAKYQLGEYYIKELPQIIPQKDYYSVYAKNSFYVFSHRLQHNVNVSYDQERRHYQLIEQIFVFVATELVSQGAHSFQVKFGRGVNLTDKRQNEDNSFKELSNRFAEKYLFKGKVQVKKIVAKEKGTTRNE